MSEPGKIRGGNMETFTVSMPNLGAPYNQWYGRADNTSAATVTIRKNRTKRETEAQLERLWNYTDNRRYYKAIETAKATREAMKQNNRWFD